MVNLPVVKRGRRHKYPQWMRETIVASVADGKTSISEMSRVYDIPITTIKYWVDLFFKEKAPAVTADRGIDSVTESIGGDRLNDTSAQGSAQLHDEEV